ncbi:MAG: FHA domain-containing protein [Eubacterium sp.]|nr:FHA domain-containing protein [Eubacterium sp.]
MKKKRLATWQFILVELLLVFLLVTMILPYLSATREKMLNWNNELADYYGIPYSEIDSLKSLKDHQEKMDELGIDYKEAELTSFISRRIIYDLSDMPAARFDELVTNLKKDTGLNVGYISALELMFGPDVRKISFPEEYEPYELSDKLELIAPVLSGAKIILWIFYILTLLMALFIPICLAVKVSRIIPLACVTAYGVAVAVLMFVIRGGCAPIPKPIWTSLLTPLTIFIIIAAFVLCAIGLLCIVLYLVSGKTAAKAAAAPVFGAENNAGAAPMFGAETTAAEAAPLFGAETTSAEAAPLFGAEPGAGAAPLFGAGAGGGEIVGYDPYTGEPIYGNQAAAPQTESVITGYDPYTGEPIYGASEELTPPPMPMPPSQEEELTPPPMPLPPAPEPENDDTPMTEVWIEDPEQGQERVPTAEQRMGTVVAVSGVANGQGFRLPATNVITVGSNPKKASWVIDHKLISGEHCQIRYHADSNQYIVTDLSRNGTFVGKERLKKEEPTELNAGTILSLADGTNQIRLG